MMQHSTIQHSNISYGPFLLEHLTQHTGFKKWLVIGFGILLSNLLLAIASKIQIPFIPVPLTLQWLVVMLMVGMMGRLWAFSAVAAYVVEGCMGLPVFAMPNPAGWGYLLGPTGGYLIGFLVATWMMGTILIHLNATGEKARSSHYKEGPSKQNMVGHQHSLIVRYSIAMIVGMVIVYAFGLAGLYRYVPIADLLAKGLSPFIFGDFVKTVIAVCLLALFKSKQRAGS